MTSDLPAHCCADAHFAERDLNYRSRLAGYEIDDQTFVDPQNHAQNEGFWTLVGRQLQIICEQTNAGFGSSDTVCTRRHDPLQVELPRSRQGP